MRVISVGDFEEHCRRYHESRDAEFEREYEVRLYAATHCRCVGLYDIQTLVAGPLAPHEVSQSLYNKPKNRFANIFPCEIQCAEYMM